MTTKHLFYPRAAFVVLATGICACAGPAEVPDTPDLQSLIAEYQRPTAILDEQTVTEALAMAPDLRTLAAGFQAVSAVRPGIDAANQGLAKRADSAVSVQGSLRVTVTCPGDGAEPTLDAAANGTLELTLGVERSQVLRGVSASANRCLARPSFAGFSVPASIDGPVAIDLGRNLGAREGTLTLLVSLLGEVKFGDFVFDSVTGRLTADSFETLFVLPDSTTVVLTATGGGKIGVRDQQGFWNCDLDNQVCELD